MIFSEVIKNFLTISGIDEKEANRWNFMCDFAMNSINLRLRKSEYTREENSRLAVAAAVLAYYYYAAYNSGSGVKKFSAGDITIENESTVEYAKSRLKIIEQSVSDLLYPEK
ncbi:MAG: hypothetical protein LBM65_01045, partial [Oscillospiraceae bacterium]|nr:hypothetical protein [Oscillospiraceae bacterium]